MSATPPVEITVSRHFLAWLYEQRIGLAFTTYQTNRLFLIGLKPSGELSGFERLFDRPMGLFATPDRLYLSTRYQLWQLHDALPPGETHEGYDRLYVPRVAHTTGDLDTHDVALDADGRVVFANTLYSCLATTSDRYSFRPLWQPSFISRLAPEDRCHLNGLAMDAAGQPRFVTAVSRSDVTAGWRDRRHAAGCLIDVQENRIVLDTLSMPHSPRLARDRLWLLNAGTGDFGWVDLQRGAFEAATFCPGFLRGLAFWGQWAIVGMSKPRSNRAFSGLALDERMAAKDADARCGLYIIDLHTGSVVHWLQLEGVVTELYDVAVLPNTTRPMALGFKSDEISRLITIEQGSQPVFHPLVPIQPSADVERSTLNVQPAPRPPLPAPRSKDDPIAILQQARAAHQSGDLLRAEALYRAALTARPGHAPTWHFLGQLLAAQGKHVEALQSFEQAAGLDPKQPVYPHNQAEMLRVLGQPAEAEAAYRRALAARSGYALSHGGLATLLADTGRAGEAIAHFRKALAANTHDARLLSGLALALVETGQTDRARQLFQRALQADPTFAEAHNNLGGLLKLEGRLDEALAAHQQAARLRPDFALAHRNIGAIREEQGQTEEASAAYGRALVHADEPLLALHQALLCPPVMESNAAIDRYRAHVARVLDDYGGDDPAGRLYVDLSRLQASRAEPPLEWAYQGRDDDHGLKARYARLFAGRFPTAPAPGSGEAKPHVGFLVTPGHEGIFVRAMSATLRHLAAGRFRVTLAGSAAAERFLLAGLAAPGVDYLRLPLRFDHALAALGAARFDALHFWETGTDSMNFFLPFCRLAPLQCTGWGWPATSAAPEMDVYLTSAALATAESDAHFTEKLVRLPHLPPAARPPVHDEPLERAYFGLPDGPPLYLCVQNLRKVHPDFDPILADLLRRDPQALLVFVADRHKAITARLQARWARTLPEAGDRIRWLPWQPADAYHRLLPLASVALDTVHFGGAMTCYDTLAAGVPLVTLPTPFQRGRFALAAYRTIGVPDCIAATPDEYVALATRLAHDDAFHDNVSQRLRAASPALWDEAPATQALAAFFEGALEQARQWPRQPP